MAGSWRDQENGRRIAVVLGPLQGASEFPARVSIFRGFHLGRRKQSNLDRLTGVTQQAQWHSCPGCAFPAAG